MGDYHVRFRERFGVKFPLSTRPKWDCKYHLVFAPKYRRQVIYKDIKADVGQILGTLCRRKGIEIIEAQCMPDHIHMLVSIPPKYSVSEVVGYLKGKSSLMI
ncbi:IS200/IS605 family transposase, partial [Enterocloster citroniae]